MSYHLAKEQNIKTKARFNNMRKIKRLHKAGLRHKYSHHPTYPPFTKAWEWEQCCCHHVE